MCLRNCVRVFACVLLAAFVRSAAAEEHPWGGAYVNVVSGSVVLDAPDARGQEPLEAGMPLAEGDRLASGSGGFVEVAFRSGLTVWADADTDVVVQSIFTGPVLVLERGSLFVHVPDYFSNDVYLDIPEPEVHITIRPGSLARVTLGPDFPAVVDQWAGQAFIEAVDNRASIYPAQRVSLRDGQGFSVSNFITEPATRFEVQSLARYRRIMGARQQEDYREHRLQGIDALEGYGRWYYDADFGCRVWRPHVASGWRPFYNGRWLHHPRGVYWIARDPWGGVTCHYGTWRYSRQGYWCWIPGYAFTPAAVQFYSCGDYIAWIPMGMHTSFSYGTWWPDYYYRYMVMCRRGSLYGDRGRHCSGRHGRRGGCDDDAFTKPKPGALRDVKEVETHTLPAPEFNRKPETAPEPRQKANRPKEGGELRAVREKPQEKTRTPDLQRGDLQVVPGEPDLTSPDERTPSPGTVRRGRRAQVGEAPGTISTPDPDVPDPREQRRSSGGVRREDRVISPRQPVYDLPSNPSPPPVFSPPQPGTGSLRSRPAPSEPAPAQSRVPEPRMRPRERHNEPLPLQDSP